MEGTITPRYLLSQFDSAQDDSGIPVVDTGWFYADLYVKLLATRAALYTKLNDLDPTVVNKYMQQTLGCVKLREAHLHTCPCAPPPECTWFEADIPVPIGQLISVSGIGMQIHNVSHYTYCEWNNFKYVLQSRNPAERTRGYYTEKNNKLYIISKKHEEVISVSAVWYDPVEAQRQYGCDAKGMCKPFLDFDFYLPPEYVELVMAATLDVVLGNKKLARFDIKNDAIAYSPSFAPK